MKTRTTIMIDSELFKALKAYASLKGLTLSDLLDEAIYEKLLRDLGEEHYLLKEIERG